jgi:hypothetical protein
MIAQARAVNRARETKGDLGEKSGGKSFISRILVSKFFDIRILRGISC